MKVLPWVPAFFLRLLFALLARLNVEICSDFGGWLLRQVGPWLPVNRVAESNLRRALPALTNTERQRIIIGVWDNLGRTVAEFPHLPALRATNAGAGWEVEGEAHMQAAFAQCRQVTFFSGHLGNWELILPIASALGVPLAGFYRAAGNPFVNRALQDIRLRAAPGVLMFAKGPVGARAALRHMAAGGSLGALVDQKMNDGIAAPFFGQLAMTAPALAQLALRFNCPVVPARVRRIGGARFRLVFEAPLPFAPTGDRAADILALTSQMNATLERWIREEPHAWLWMHRRWPKQGCIP
jgi:KDO2-lipid IV(A) lauroyltransferase